MSPLFTGILVAGVLKTIPRFSILKFALMFSIVAICLKKGD